MVFPRSTVALVNDEYDEQIEIMARANGPDLYLSKPLEADWLLTPLYSRRG